MGTKYIAHRGFALLNTENTIEAFTHAAGSAVFGIETDIQVTKDKHFVCFHDDNTLRLCGVEKLVTESTFQELQELRILGKHKIPTLVEYIQVCKSGGKVAVVELKNRYSDDDIVALVQQIKNQDYLMNTIFISFEMRNVLSLRKLLPNQDIQFITTTYDRKLLETLSKERIDLNVRFTRLTRSRIAHCQSLGINVNCWTLNNEKIANHFKDAGIDFITSDILGA